MLNEYRVSGIWYLVSRHGLLPLRHWRSLRSLANSAKLGPQARAANHSVTVIIGQFLRISVLFLGFLRSDRLDRTFFIDNGQWMFFN